MTENEIDTIIINNSSAIHKELGAGLFESVYTSILYHLLSEQNLRVEKQVLIPVRFRELWFDE
jgi:GxxExxY protein